MSGQRNALDFAAMTTDDDLLILIGYLLHGQYNSVDTSILSVNVMHPFWNWCVQFFPRWMAPNLITFTGFLLTVVNFVLIGYYDYGFDAATHTVNPVPGVVWLIAAVNIFVAYTLGE